MSASPSFPETALILAGGLGTRLRASVADRPKVLAPAAGKPFLDYLLRFLQREGIQKVILSTGYLGEQVQDFVKDGARWKMQVEVVHEPAPLGTGGGMRWASQRLTEPFFALNGDTLFFASLAALWATHCQRTFEATLALLPVQNGQERGVVRLEATGHISAFSEKPQEAGPALISAGLYVITPAALASLPPGSAASLEKQVFPRLAEQGKLGGWVSPAYFADIGTPLSLQAFERDLQAGKVPL